MNDNVNLFGNVLCFKFTKMTRKTLKDNPKTHAMNTVNALVVALIAVIKFTFHKTCDLYLHVWIRRKKENVLVQGGKCLLLNPCQM